MARLELESSPGITIESAFDNYEEAHQRATEVFICVVAAVGRDGDGTKYLRPAVSRDPNIFAYVVLTFGE